MRPFLFLLLFFAPASVQSEWNSNIDASMDPNALLENGFPFNERSKILLSENFIRVEFLVPFSQYDFPMKPDIEAMIYRLSTLWQVPSLFSVKLFECFWQHHRVLMSIGCFRKSKTKLLKLKKTSWLSAPKPLCSSRHRSRKPPARG